MDNGEYQSLRSFATAKSLKSLLLKVGGIVFRVWKRSFLKPLASPAFYSYVPCTVGGKLRSLNGNLENCLCAAHSLLMWYVFRERGQALRLNTKIKMDFTPPSVNSMAQKSIVL